MLWYDIATYTKHWEDLYKKNTHHQNNSGGSDDDSLAGYDDRSPHVPSSTAVPSQQSQDEDSTIMEMEKEMDLLLSLFEDKQDEDDRKRRIYGIGDNFTFLRLVQTLHFRCTMI